MVVILHGKAYSRVELTYICPRTIRFLKVTVNWYKSLESNYHCMLQCLHSAVSCARTIAPVFFHLCCTFSALTLSNSSLHADLLLLSCDGFFLSFLWYIVRTKIVQLACMLVAANGYCCSVASCNGAVNCSSILTLPLQTIASLHWTPGLSCLNWIQWTLPRTRIYLNSGAPTCSNLVCCLVYCWDNWFYHSWGVCFPN